MGRNLSLNESFHVLDLTRRLDDGRATQTALPLGRLLGQDVALVCLEAPDLSRCGHRETLLGALVRFHLWHGYFGVRIMTIDFPSSRASLSTLATSTRDAATRSTTSLPSSGCAICRPRNIIVTFTLFPSCRNSRAWRVFVSKSWSSMPGRYFTSFRWMTCCFFFARRAILACSNLNLP